MRGSGEWLGVEMGDPGGPRKIYVLLNSSCTRLRTSYNNQCEGLVKNGSQIALYVNGFGKAF